MASVTILVNSAPTGGTCEVLPFARTFMPPRLARVATRPNAPQRAHARAACAEHARTDPPQAAAERTCTQVSPKAGFALTTPFRIRCARWADIDAPLRYEFGTRLGRVGSPLFLSATLAPTGELYLPSG
jgi:hypothetical protein